MINAFIVLTLLIIIMIIPFKANSISIDYEHSGDNGPLWIYRSGDYRCLTFVNPFREIKNQTCMLMTSPKVHVFPYTKNLMSLLMMTPEPKRLLILGLGGGTLYKSFRELFPNLHIDIVELNQDVIDAAYRYFLIPKDDPYLTIHTQSAQSFVEREVLYDLIIVDVFDETYIPKDILTVKFFEKLKSMLDEGGSIGVNTFGKSPYAKEEEILFETVFKEYYVLGKTNRVIIYKKGEIPSRSELLERDLFWREHFIQFGIDPFWMLGQIIHSPEKG